MPSAGLTRVGRFVQRALASARYRALDARRRLRDWRLRPSSMASGAGFEGDAAAARGVLFVLSGVPIDDTGGGARCTQFALEALRQGFAVVFVNRFPKRETVDLKLEIRHPLLVTSALAGFSLDQLRRDHPRVLDGKPVGVLCGRASTSCATDGVPRAPACVNSPRSRPSAPRCGSLRLPRGASAKPRDAHRRRASVRASSNPNRTTAPRDG